MSRQPLACAAAIALLAGAGCIHQEVRRSPETDTTLTITRSGETVLLGWRSRPDRIYTVMYSEKLGAGAVWKALPAATLVKGSGSAMNITDSVPDGNTRYYRLQIQRTDSAGLRSR